MTTTTQLGFKCDKTCVQDVSPARVGATREHNASDATRLFTLLEPAMFLRDLWRQQTLLR